MHVRDAEALHADDGRRVPRLRSSVDRTRFAIVSLGGADHVSGLRAFDLRLFPGVHRMRASDGSENGAASVRGRASRGAGPRTRSRVSPCSPRSDDHFR